MIFSSNMHILMRQYMRKLRFFQGKWQINFRFYNSSYNRCCNCTSINSFIKVSIRNTFSDALEGLGDGIVDLTVFLVGNSPYLLVFGILGFVILKLAKRPGKKLSFRKKAKKQDKE